MTTLGAWGQEYAATSKRNSFLLQCSSSPPYWQTRKSSFIIIEEHMAIHSSILASVNHMNRGAWWGYKESDRTEHQHRQWNVNLELRGSESVTGTKYLWHFLKYPFLKKYYPLALFCSSPVHLSQRRRRADNASRKFYQVSRWEETSCYYLKAQQEGLKVLPWEELFWFRRDDWWWEFGSLLLWSGESHGNILLSDL